MNENSLKAYHVFLTACEYVTHPNSEMLTKEERVWP